MLHYIQQWCSPVSEKYRLPQSTNLSLFQRFVQRPVHFVEIHRPEDVGQQPFPASGLMHAWFEKGGPRPLQVAIQLHSGNTLVTIFRNRRVNE
jgi:hypothetical protein